MIRRTRNMPSPQADGRLLPVQARRWRKSGRLWTATPPATDNPYSPLTLSVLFDGVAANPGESVNFGTSALFKPERTDTYSGNCWMQSSEGGTVGTSMLGCLRGSTGWNMKYSSTVAGNFRLIGPRAALQDSNVSSVPAGGAPLINDGSFHMLTWTSRGNSPLTPADIEIYIDAVRMVGGQRSGSGSVTDTTILGSSDLVIANQDTQLSNFLGNICHVSTWNIELTPAQVIEVYGLARPQKLDELTSSANLVFWNPCGDGDGLGAGEFLDISGNANNGTQTDLEIGDFVTDVPG